ncbi:hypothetical protein CMEL01_08571, partial [Colletotrichum melonis]
PTPQGANSVNLDRLIKVPAKAVKVPVANLALYLASLPLQTFDRSYDESEPRPAPPWLPPRLGPLRKPLRAVPMVPVWCLWCSVQPQRRSSPQLKIHLTSPTTTTMEYVAANTNTALLHLRRHRYARPPAYTGDHHASGVPSCSSPLKLPRL